MPEVSFIIGHRGADRIPLLIATLASIAAQEQAAIECIVVEQSGERLLSAVIPPWVHHVHTPPPSLEMPYSRSWAFNVGARLARGRCLVLHDNDVLVPTRYAAEVLAIVGQGFDAVRLQRFVFNLDRVATEAILACRDMVVVRPPQQVVQNCEGHTLAVSANVYWSIGGHDEAFEGWGGEDNEFFDRLQSSRLHDHAYLPFVHLHHEPQRGKGGRNPNSEYFEQRMRMAVEERIVELSMRPSGLLSGPVSEAGTAAGRGIPA